MDHSKKVLILYASAGHGHEKAAQAVLEAYQTEFPGINIQKKDVLSLTIPFFGRYYRNSYLFQIQNMPWLWAFLYYTSDIRWVYFCLGPFRRLVNGFMAAKLHNLLVQENPDVVISTHFMATEVTSYLKGRGKIQSRAITIVTDYLPHYIWTAKHVDAYMVAIPETKKALQERGVPEKKIHVFGIPIEKKFIQKNSREELCARLGVLPGVFTVLLTSGGAGVGAMQDIIKGVLSLNHKIQMLAICGTNKVLFEALSKDLSGEPLLKVFGFVNNMHELMDASDMVVGKGGGLTITESLSKEKPVILFRSVPGQEGRNVYCVRRYGAGFATNKVGEVIRKIEEFYKDPEGMSRMRGGARKMARPLAARDICLWVENGQ